jgi:hypothetical protein
MTDSNFGSNVRSIVLKGLSAGVIAVISAIVVGIIFVGASQERGIYLILLRPTQVLASASTIGILYILPIFIACAPVAVRGTYRLRIYGVWGGLASLALLLLWRYPLFFGQICRVTAWGDDCMQFSPAILVAIISIMLFWFVPRLRGV